MKKTFAPALLNWFAQNMRPLPWRNDYTPYRIWISEIMLQQTQMERGVEYFTRWMTRFPTIDSVANAGETEILAAWEGLGYYTRAKNLHKAAKIIAENHKGIFPETYEDIRNLPGVGDYTAGAISSIAFNRPHPAVDANVLRIFARLCDMTAPVTSPETKATITDLVQTLTPKNKAREFCQAMMEFGALVCNKTPRCGECPVSSLCQALQRGTIKDRPVKNAKPQYKQLITAAAILLREDEIFIQQRPQTGLWPSLWEFPTITVENNESPEFALARAIGGGLGEFEKIATVQHGYTTWRVTLHGYLLRVGKKEKGQKETSFTVGDGEWVKKAEVKNYAFPSGQRKLLVLLGWK